MQLHWHLQLMYIYIQNFMFLPNNVDDWGHSVILQILARWRYLINFISTFFYWSLSYICMYVNTSTCTCKYKSILFTLPVINRYMSYESALTEIKERGFTRQSFVSIHVVYTCTCFKNLVLIQFGMGFFRGLDIWPWTFKDYFNLKKERFVERCRNPFNIES